MAKKKVKHYVCSFCGGNETQRGHIVTAEKANICDECILQCIKMIFKNAKVLAKIDRGRMK